MYFTDYMDKEKCHFNPDHLFYHCIMDISIIYVKQNN